MSWGPDIETYVTVPTTAEQPGTSGQIFLCQVHNLDMYLSTCLSCQQNPVTSEPVRREQHLGSEH